jgi:hypothetical protein
LDCAFREWVLYSSEEGAIQPDSTFPFLRLADSAWGRRQG